MALGGGDDKRSGVCCGMSRFDVVPGFEKLGEGLEVVC